MRIYHSLFTHSVIDAYLGSFQVVTITNRARMNILIQISLGMGGTYSRVYTQCGAAVAGHSTFLQTMPDHSPERLLDQSLLLPAV